MLFNSLDFAIFLPIVFILYWFVLNKQIKHQNILIVIASYVFYGWWDWRFLSLIFFSTLLDFTIGLKLFRQKNIIKRKTFLWISILINLGFLGFFKYYNFFIENFTQAFSFFGAKIQPNSLNIILPVGISFYTFQTLSYTIDVYRRKLEPTKQFISFAAFVSFFPQLVAGPIERASNLLPQFYIKRNFNKEQSIIGVNQILWGLFKKIVIADNCAQYVNDIFFNYNSYSSFTLVLGAIYFSFQIYCDFSGYSDIAIGTARLFGFNLKVNFKYPYFSKDIAEFWRRWHISLSTWFRDYLYIPLGGSKGSNLKKIRNVFIIFTVSGFWHGANWTYVFWGFLNAVLFIPIFFLRKNDKLRLSKQNKNFKHLTILVKMFITYIFVTLGWVFFRSNTIFDAIQYLKLMFSFSLKIDKLGLERYSFEILPLILLLVIIEWVYRKREFPIYTIKPSKLKLFTLLLLILVFGSYSEIMSFIYFQF